MPTLHVALQEGFEEDDVCLRVDGREAAVRQGLKSRHQIGLADSIDVELPEGQHTVEVEITSRKIADTVTVDLAQSTFLAVSISPSGEMQMSTSKEPFRYL